ncbi:Cc8L18.2-like protein [Daphnia magna]|uniref:Cc8L18.2-like protein n=1 Tax=Daphnia magna TaxID=35525 RepID=A0A164P6P1_9CRUS|nr:Cc8L18.2-like protein [Daphnia magna]
MLRESDSEPENENCLPGCSIQTGTASLNTLQPVFERIKNLNPHLGQSTRSRPIDVATKSWISMKISTFVDVVCWNLKTILYRVNLLHLSTICVHLKHAFTSQFHFYKKSSKCANPFGNHQINKKLPKGTKYPSLTMCDSIKEIQRELHVYPGQKLCPNCYMTFKSVIVTKLPKTPQFSSHTSPIESELEDCEAELNNISLQNDTSFSSLTDSPSQLLSRSHSETSALQVTPVVIDKKRSKSQCLQVILRKTNQIQTAFIKLHDSIANVVEVLDTDDKTVSDLMLPSDCVKLRSELKERCESLKLKRDYSGILSLLTLAPESWSQQSTSIFFDVSISKVKISRILKNEKGILATSVALTHVKKK